MTEQPATLPSLLASVVAARGSHDAVAMPHETLSYDELDRRTGRLARALLAHGAGKGTRIALMAPDGIMWLTSFLAGLRIGALVSAVSTLATPPELAHILRASDAQIVISARNFLRHDYAATLEAALPGLADGEVGKLRLTTAPYLRSIFLDDAEGLRWAGSIDALAALADLPDAPDATLLAEIEKEVVPGDPAVIVYTSGSTSAPKAVIHSQKTIARHPVELAKLFLIRPDDRMMPMLPAFWLGGMAMLFQVLSQGATLVYPGSPAIEDFAQAFLKLGVNRINGWGDGLVKLKARAAELGVDVDSITGFLPFRDKAGEVLPPELSSNMLGMSETFAPHSAEPIDVRLPADKAGASGRSVNNYERRIVDPETGEILGPDQIGELQLRGGGLTIGFYKRDPAEVFTPDGFYPTGDLCRIDADDYLYFVARRNDMIKTRAANVSRLEVEAAMRALPGVELPVVAGLPDAEFGEIVVAAVVPTPGALLDEEEMRAALRGSLSSFKVPRRIIFITHDEVPRTATGKIKLFETAHMIASHIGAPTPAKTAG